MASKIILYVSTVSSNIEMKKQQQRIEDVLSSKKFEFEKVDVASSPEQLAKMRSLVGPTALTPQLCRGDDYLGNYEDFDQAVEGGSLKDFLKEN